MVAIARTVPVVICGLAIVASLAFPQQITTQTPIHSNPNFDATKPMMSIQGAPSQSGDLLDFFTPTGTLRCLINQDADLNCPLAVINSADLSSLSVSGSSALSTLSTSGLATLNSLNVTGSSTLFGATLTAPVTGFQDAGGQVFNVLAYGAKCDGATDNSSSITAAIAAAQTAGGGIVYFPQCTSSYKFNEPLVVGNVIIRGAGQSASKLVFGGSSGTAITFNYSIPTDAWGPGMRDISLAGSSATGTVGLVLGGTLGAEGALVSNASIAGFGTGLELGANSFIWQVRGSYFSNGTDVNIGNISSSGENLLFDHCVFDHTTSFSSVVVSGSINLVRFISDSFDGSQLIVDQGYASVVDPHFENTVGGSYYAMVVGDGTHNAYVTLDGGELWEDGANLPPNNSFINVNGGAVANVSNITVCAGASAAFNILYGAGDGSITNPIAANCGGYLNHPIAAAGTGSFTQIVGDGFGTNIATNIFQGGIKAGSVTVATLPTAGSSTGAWYTVTDSTTITAEGQACLGGGTAVAAAFSNGSTWKCF